MKYKVELYESVNGLKFGTDRDTVRKTLGDFSNITERDMFSNCFAEYRNEKLISIEIFGEFVVEVNGVIFSSNDEFEEMERKILLLDPDANIDGCGATSKKCSIGTYFENGFESFLIGVENYYS